MRRNAALLCYAPSLALIGAPVDAGIPHLPARLNSRLWLLLRPASGTPDRCLHAVVGHTVRAATGADKIAGSDFEPPQAGPKGEGQDARSNPRRSPKAPAVGATASEQAFLLASLASYPQKSVFKPATLRIVLEFPLQVVWRGHAFVG
jgi:hypothetical protein